MQGNFDYFNQTDVQNYDAFLYSIYKSQQNHTEKLKVSGKCVTLFLTQSAIICTFSVCYL